MTDLTASTEPVPRAQAGYKPSLRAIAIKYKWLSLSLLVLLVLFVVALVPSVLTSGSWKVADTTSCDNWSSANQNQQAAYARLYVREHGPLPSGATSPASILTAINNGCTAAFAYDEPDQVTVVDAINGRY